MFHLRVKLVFPKGDQVGELDEALIGALSYQPTLPLNEQEFVVLSQSLKSGNEPSFVDFTVDATLSTRASFQIDFSKSKSPIESIAYWNVSNALENVPFTVEGQSIRFALELVEVRAGKYC